MIGVRETLEAFQRFLRSDGLLYGPEGWNTLDWVPAWDQDAGVPPDGHEGASGLMNWQLIYALVLAADMEDQLGESELAALFRKRAIHLAQCAVSTFWDGGRGLLADDKGHLHFSEHTQCMALLGDTLLPGLLSADLHEKVAAGLLNDLNLERTTIYFTHYLFETLRALGRIDVLMERMALWFSLPGQGFKTTREMPEPSRSDCHAWGAHPLFHYFATILGIRPASPGFKTVEIMPQLGPLERAEGRLVHPSGGEIGVSFNQEEGRLSGRVRLPEGVTGRLVCNDQVMELTSGENVF
jgi:alpha-L-rhamnosidase